MTPPLLIMPKDESECILEEEFAFVLARAVYQDLHVLWVQTLEHPLADTKAQRALDAALAASVAQAERVVADTYIKMLRRRMQTGEFGRSRSKPLQGGHRDDAIH